MKNSIWIVLVSALLLASCGGKKVNLFKNDFNGLVEHKSGDGFFRGISPGDSILRVLDYENEANRLFMDSLVVRYRIMVSDSEFYDINYGYDHEIVNLIKFEAVLPQIPDGDLFFDKLEVFFTQKCGDPVIEKGVYSWMSKDSISVELYNESEEYGYGSVIMYIYKGREALPNENDFLDTNLFLVI